jgi:hypothetical protein
MLVLSWTCLWVFLAHRIIRIKESTDSIQKVIYLFLITLTFHIILALQPLLVKEL